MDSAKWVHATGMESDDVMVSDNLLEFVKDEDIVAGLDTPDDILPHDIFNEIINKFDFDDSDVNINSFLNDLNTVDNSNSTINDFVAKNLDDPLLSSSNASINYNDFNTQTALIQSKTTISQQQQPQQQPSTQQQQPQQQTSISHLSTNTTTQLPQIISSSPIRITTAEIPQQLETVVYQIANNSIGSNTFVTTASSVQSQQLISGLTPIQMVFNNVETTNFQPVQKYAGVNGESQPIVVQSGGILNSTKVVDSNGKSIILNPTVVYANATPVTSNSMQSVQLINTANGAILTQVPVSTIMVEQEHEKPPKVKEVKRSTHNAIERRYRTSINDKIVELKNMLVGEAGKLNKSAILKRTIEKISDLETENYELRLQNARMRELLLAQGPISADESSLRTLLLQKTIKPTKRRYTNSSNGSGSEYGNQSPATSDESNPSLSPARSDTGSMSPLGGDEISTEIDRSAKRKKNHMDNITTHGMSSMSKLTLCALMFAIITLNPLASLLSDSTSSASVFEETSGATRRGILEDVDIENGSFFQSIWPQVSNSFVALILNIILMTVCLVKLCYHSDPVMNFRSPTADKYFKQKMIADAEFDKGNASAAFIAYEKCLQMFGVTLPQSWFELVPMTIWQFLRCCFHRLRFGQWLSRKFGRIIRSDETEKDALNSAQELAIILNRCNQIHLSQNISNGCGLILSMYAVNMAEVAQNISTLTLIDIYLTAALRCRKNYVYFFSWMCSRYYFYKARNEASLLCGQRLQPKYNWIFNNAYGYKYICKFSFDDISKNLESESLFSSDINPLDTLSIVFASYNEHLLKCALQCLIGVSYTSNNDIKSCIAMECNDATVIRDVLNYSELLKENCQDPLTLWWANLFTIDACWLLGDDATADKMFDNVRKVPKVLRESKDPLARTAVIVFCAKKLLAMKQKQSEQKIWSLCNCASKMFSESLVYNKATKNDMILFIHLLVCDWLLETRTSCWEMEQNSKFCTDDDNNNQVLYNPLPSKQLEQFQADLNSLHCIIDYIPTAKSRIYLYEAVTRLMAGAAPGHTQELLDRSFHEQYRRNNRSTFHCGGSGSKEAQQNTTIETVNRRRCGQNAAVAVDGERERAAAMYVACKYLPNPLLCLPGERVGMLAEAAKTLKKIGNRKRLNDCYQLMQSFRTTTVPTDCN